MKVTLESRPADSGIDDPELGWTPVTTKLLKAKTKKFSRAKSIKRRQPQTQITIWQDKIKLPSTSQQQYRLLVKEYEVFLADKKIPEKSHLPGKWGVQERRRLVYAHAIALTI